MGDQIHHLLLEFQNSINPLQIFMVNILITQHRKLLFYPILELIIIVYRQILLVVRYPSKNLDILKRVVWSKKKYKIRGKF